MGLIWPVIFDLRSVHICENIVTRRFSPLMSVASESNFVHVHDLIVISVINNVQKGKVLEYKE